MEYVPEAGFRVGGVLFALDIKAHKQKVFDPWREPLGKKPRWIFVCRSIETYCRAKHDESSAVIEEGGFRHLDGSHWPEASRMSHIGLAATTGCEGR